MSESTTATGSTIENTISEARIPINETTVSGAGTVTTETESAVTTIPETEPATTVAGAASTPAPVIPTSPVVEIPTSVPTPPTPQEISDARDLSIIEELLTNYKAILSAKVVTAKSFNDAAVYLDNVIDRVLRTQTTAVFDYLWNFFIENASGILTENRALSGVEALSPKTRTRTELVYTLFRKATKGIDASNPANINQGVLTTQVKAPKLIAYLAAKSKTIK